MKTPWYETSPGALAALLFTGSFVDVDVYTFYLAGTILGVSTLRYSAGDVDVSIPSFYWSAKEVLFDQSKSKAVAHWKVGLDVDTWQVVAVPRPGLDTIGSASWLAAIRAGALDGAEVQVDRCFAPDFNQTTVGTHGMPAFAPTGIVSIFYGRIAQGDVGRSQAVITINSHMKLLQADMPRRLYQAACIHNLFDSGCNNNGSLPPANFAATGSVTSVSTDGSEITTTLAAPVSGKGTYALGRIQMTSGASDGFQRMITSWAHGSPSTLVLKAPFPLGIAPGDTYTAYPGCDKKPGTCSRVFNNLANYGGELGIPAPEAAV